MSSISAIIIAKNEEEVIQDAIMSVSFCNEVIVIDSGSNDHTVLIAKKNNAKVYKLPFTDFASLRTEALSKVQSNWVLYIDSDERVTSKLRDEIKKTIQDHNEQS